MDDFKKDPIDLQDGLVDFMSESSEAGAESFAAAHEQQESFAATAEAQKTLKTAKEGFELAHENNEQVKSKLGRIRSALIGVTKDKLMQREITTESQDLKTFGALLKAGKVFHSQETGYPGDMWAQAKRFAINGAVLVSAVFAEKYLPGAGKVVAMYGPAAYAGDQLGKEHGFNRLGRLVTAAGTAALMGGGTEVAAEHMPSIIESPAKVIGNLSDDALLYHEQIAKAPELATKSVRVVKKVAENLVSRSETPPPTGSVSVEKPQRKQLHKVRNPRPRLAAA